MRELCLVRLSHLSVIIEAANVDTVFKAACPRVQVNTVALENIWLYSTFRLCFKDRRQMENFGGPGWADWTRRVTSTEKMCSPGVCQVHLHPCSPGHKERSLNVEGTGPGLGAKKQMGFSFQVWFTGQCTKYYIRCFSLIMTKVGMLVTESEIF